MPHLSLILCSLMLINLLVAVWGTDAPHPSEVPSSGKLEKMLKKSNTRTAALPAIKDQDDLTWQDGLRRDMAFLAAETETIIDTVISPREMTPLEAEIDADIGTVITGIEKSFIDLEAEIRCRNTDALETEISAGIQNASPREIDASEAVISVVLSPEEIDDFVAKIYAATSPREIDALEAEITAGIVALEIDPDSTYRLRKALASRREIDSPEAEIAPAPIRIAFPCAVLNLREIEPFIAELDAAEGPRELETKMSALISRREIDALKAQDLEPLRLPFRFCERVEGLLGPGGLVSRHIQQGQ